MHITEGVLTPPVLAAGAAIAAAGLAVGLKKTHYDQIPRVAVLSSAFYVASLIHVRLGATSAHLILSGLMGIILGWAIFPAVMVALVLQAVFFRFGGLTTLGVNTLIMAVPGLVCYFLFNAAVRTAKGGWVFACGFAAGALAVAMGCALLSLTLLSSGTEFVHVIKLVIVMHTPVIVVEGLVTGSVTVFLRKVRPELLGAPAYAAAGKENAHG